VPYGLWQYFQEVKEDKSQLGLCYLQNCRFLQEHAKSMETFRTPSQRGMGRAKGKKSSHQIDESGKMKTIFQ
jgi:hypothetical protein